MLDDMAVPDELTGLVEFGPDARDLARVRNHRVLVAGFPGFRQRNLPAQLDRLHDLALLIEDEALAVDDLEDDLVDVHRVGVASGVVELPDFGRADFRVLGDALHPQLRGRDARFDNPEQRFDGSLELAAVRVAPRAHLLDKGEWARHGLRR